MIKQRKAFIFIITTIIVISTVSLTLLLITEMLSGLALLIGFSFFIMFICLLLIGSATIIRNKEKKLLLTALIGIFVISTSFLISQEVIAYQEKLSIKNGNKIVEAIEKYYIENNSLPSTLNDLVPIYIEEIPSTEMFISNGNYHYNLINHKTYEIKFNTQALLQYMYNNENNEWVIFD